MTGMEAWSIIAPILAAHTVRRNGDSLNALDEAYVLVFSVLNRYDEMEKEPEQEPAGN